MKTINKKRHHLVQIKAPKDGLNFHRAWFDEIQGITIVSNDDIAGNKFRIENKGSGETPLTVWYSSPIEAAIAFHSLNAKAN